MVRLTRKVFIHLAIRMIGLDFVTVAAVPFFLTIPGLSSSLVLAWWFFGACVSASIVVGAVNVGIACVCLVRHGLPEAADLQ